jgi:phospholipid N-methyltransferase
MQQTLTFYGLDAPDAVISGIPFSTMSRASASLVLQTIASGLGPSGCFVAYQLSKCVADLGQPFFGSAHVQTEFFNIPPIRIYRWTKPAAIALD